MHKVRVKHKKSARYDETIRKIWHPSDLHNQIGAVSHISLGNLHALKLDYGCAELGIMYNTM